MSSDVARIRGEINLVCQSMYLAMNGYSITARHDIINHKYDQLGALHERLCTMVGPEESLQVMIAAIDTADANYTSSSSDM